jgi:Tfp pilus assembly protein FimT
LRSATFELLAGIQQARVTSIEESRPSLLCPADSAGRCVAAGVAATGWRSFIEEDGGRRALGGQLLPSGAVLRATRSPIHFWPTSLAASTGTLTICPAAGRAASAVPPRAIVISQAGRPRVDVGAPEDCAP